MTKESTKYRLEIPSLRVDRGDHHEALTRGDSCDDVPPGTLEALLRTGKAVLAGDFVEDRFDAETVSEPEPIDWTSTSLEDLGLSAATRKTLNAAGFRTAGDVLEYGSQNEGLTGIDGVGDATEKEIQSALQKLANN